MAILGIVNKQPREVIDFDISFDTFLKDRADTLVSVNSEVFPSGLNVLYTSIDSSIVKCVVAGGLDGQSYKVTVLTSTSAGLLLEDEVNVMVQEV
jgi:hypothetical protein